MAPGQGWYEDPSGQQQLRWWDGATWTDRTQPVPPAAAPPANFEPPASLAAPSSAPADLAPYVHGPAGFGTLPQRAWQRYRGWPKWAQIVAPIVLLGAMGGVSDGLSSLTHHGPDYTVTAPAGAFAQCKDGQFSDNTDFDKTCSSHDGVQHWVAPYVVCRDGTVLTLNEDTSCGGKRGGVDRTVDENTADALKAASSTTASPALGLAGTSAVPSTTASPTTTATPAPATTVAPVPTTTVAPPTTKGPAAPSTGRTLATPTSAAPAPAVPSGTCTATISNPLPTKNLTEVVTVTSNMPNAPVALVAGYKTTSTSYTGVTDASRRASISFKIGGATSGYEVDVVVTVAGATVCRTSFTPQ